MVKGGGKQNKNLDMENQGSFPKYLQCEIQMDRKQALQNERDFDMIFQMKLFF